LSKIKTAYFCSNCGSQHSKWEGRCNSCGEWNTLEEEIIQKETKSDIKSKAWKEPKANDNKPKRLDEVVIGETQRLRFTDNELNRVLGGGIVPGSLVLLGGQPGIGKSTLLLQICLRIQTSILYVSGEESKEQIKMRANRIQGNNDACLIYNETNIDTILKQAKHLMPSILIIDSIQTLYSPHIESTAGTVSQVRECTSELQKFAKTLNIPVFIIGHITKEGSLAGPKLLEHIVDVVLHFEGDKLYAYRILRTIKNRFGSTDEIGIYEMQADGMREVDNPSELLLSQNEDRLSGIAVAASMEGMRPLLIEVQALVSPAIYGNPQRSATGFDLRRLSMLLAVLEKRCGLAYGQQDVFLNLAGGLKITDPALDLAVVASLISSLQDISLSDEMAFIGEVGLSGEVRSVSRIDQRLQEAARLGRSQIYISKYSLKGIDTSKYDANIVGISKVDDLLREVFA